MIFSKKYELHLPREYASEFCAPEYIMQKYLAIMRFVTRSHQNTTLQMSCRCNDALHVIQGICEAVVMQYFRNVATNIRHITQSYTDTQVTETLRSIRVA